MKKEILQRALEEGIKKGVKSIFFFPDFPPLGNRQGLIKLGSITLTNRDIEDIIESTLTHWQTVRLENEKELEYGYEIKKGIRFRMAAFYRLGEPCIVARPIPVKIPSFESLGIPPVIKEFTELKHGIVLVTGPTGSGKSTTLASLIDIINENKRYHIITIEDPIEFIHESKNSIISQREIGRDTLSYKDALKSVLREDPDVIMIGEIRDRESMAMALELAETGHLVFSTLHTLNAVQTINRIVDFFYDHEKQQIRNQISIVLKGVVSQRLIRNKTGDGFVCACEVLKIDQGIANLIREDKIHQISSFMDSIKTKGSISMDDSLIDLYKKNVIGLSDVIDNVCDSKKIEMLIKKDKNHYTEGLLYGKEILDTEYKSFVYKVDCKSKNLSCFDASGILIDTQDGMLFKDSGQSRGGFHFIGDYTILNGKKSPFKLKNYFNFSYIIKEVNVKKSFYKFQLKVVESVKSAIELPNKPYELLFDGNWHSATIPVPKIFHGRIVKYFLMCFDKDIREIEFSNIYFS